MRSKSLGRASAAAVLGITLTLGTPVVFSPVAGAEDSVASNTQAGSPVIDKDATGTLTIHKKANPTSTGVPTGESTDQAGGTPLPGVGFTIYKINDIDLTTNNGLAEAATKKASQYTPAGGTDNNVTEIKSQNTDDSGVISLSNLAVGAYLVVESAPRPGYAPASPFIAFVPMTRDAANGGVEWNYDVHAFPKNYENKAEKTVDDANVNAGGVVTFTIKTDVPPVAQNVESISKYVVTDDLQENLLSTAAEKITVAGSDGTSFAKDQDYTLSLDEATQKVEIIFTSDGLSKLTQLRAADSSFQVVTTIEATVKAPSDTGSLKNKAVVVANNGAGTSDTTTNTNETETYFGNVKIVKKAAGSEALLSGAEFELYRPGNNGTCEDSDKTSENQMSLAGGVNKWTTGENGQVVIEGLHVNDFANDGKGSQDPAYCLFEVKSPKGYELLSDPITLQLTKTGATGAQSVYELTSEIKNLEKTSAQLPLTGGKGIGLLAALGAALIGAGAWYARRNSKKA